MDNINVLIIEDNPAESEELKKALETKYKVVGVAKNYAEALNLFHTHKVDVMIIDVFLDGRPDGIRFAEAINALAPNVSKPFVFLTSSQDGEVFKKAKVTRPFGFLLKPFNELEILYAIEIAVEKFYEQHNVFASEDRDTVISKEYLFIKKKDALKKVKIDDIIYIEVEERYCNIITEKEKFVILISLTRILELLDANRFCQTHRNYIANTEKIIEILPADNLIVLEGNHQIALSDKYKSFTKQFQILK
jgi:two-component system LytT family response regulator